jgi:RimJ/RimL family protein N-acetyltransferase
MNISDDKSVESIFPERGEIGQLTLVPLTEPAVSLDEVYDFFCQIDEEDQFLQFEPKDDLHGCREFMIDVHQQWESGEKAFYGLRIEGQDGIGGLCTFNCKWERRVGEFGICLLEDYWGNEYAHQAGYLLFTVGFEHLDLEVMEVAHAVENGLSHRTIQKGLEAIGGRYVGIIPNRRIVDGEPTDWHYYVMERDEFLGPSADVEGVSNTPGTSG